MHNRGGEFCRATRTARRDSSCAIRGTVLLVDFPEFQSPSRSVSPDRAAPRLAPPRPPLGRPRLAPSRPVSPRAQALSPSQFGSPASRRPPIAPPPCEPRDAPAPRGGSRRPSPRSASPRRPPPSAPPPPPIRLVRIAGGVRGAPARPRARGARASEPPRSARRGPGLAPTRPPSYLIFPHSWRARRARPRPASAASKVGTGCNAMQPSALRAWGRRSTWRRRTTCLSCRSTRRASCR